MCFSPTPFVCTLVLDAKGLEQLRVAALGVADRQLNQALRGRRVHAADARLVTHTSHHTTPRTKKVVGLSNSHVSVSPFPIRGTQTSQACMEKEVSHRNQRRRARAHSISRKPRCGRGRTPCRSHPPAGGCGKSLPRCYERGGYRPQEERTRRLNDRIIDTSSLAAIKAREARGRRGRGRRE